MNHSVTIVIPTRNRPALARNAIRSVLEQRAPGVRILVSDNSTAEDAVAEVSAFCKELNHSDLSYVRPPQPLSMTAHYDWAFSQAMLNEEATHFALLTDRMIFRRNSLAGVLRVAESFPNKIVTYNHDRVVDHSRPVLLEQYPWSGEVVEIASANLLRLSSECFFHGSLPRVMNCVVPRAVFDVIRARYGSLFDSIAPDFNFCYRSLIQFDSVVYYDAYPLVHYALDRSNGESQTRGIASPDHLDFVANLGGKSFNFAAPVPEFLTVGNAIVHEYCYARDRSGDGEVPPINRLSYFRMLEREIADLQNPRLKSQMENLFRTHRPKEPLHESPAPSADASAGESRLRQLSSPLKAFICRVASRRPQNRLPPWLRRFIEARLPTFLVLRFERTEDALEYAAAHMRRRLTGIRHLRVLGGARVRA